MTGRVEIAIARALPALDEHAAAWTRLAETSSQRAPMLGYPWMATFLEHRVPGEPWSCAFAYDGAELVGVLPAVAGTRRLGVRWRVACTPGDDHTIAVQPLVADGRAGDVIPALVRASLRAHGRPLYLYAPRVPEHSPLREVVCAGHAGLAGRSGRDRAMPIPFFEQKRAGRGAFLPVSGEFEAYRQVLSRNFRSNLAKAGNKLRKLADVRFSFITGADADPDAGGDGDAGAGGWLGKFLAVEAAGWKRDRGTAIAVSPELVAFYTALTRRLARAGWLEWHFLDAEGATLAGNLAVRLGRKILVWKLGYDEAYRRCSPGGLLFERLCERAFADPEIDEIDLMTDQPWYGNWNMQWRDYYDLRLYPWRPLPLVASWAPRHLARRLEAVPAARDAIASLRQRLRR